ncbi:MAG: DUF1987 domain-containing protein [Sulfuritalea sp.]|nr:DUF1987 domain-containing protein [Sulfuritalea sp.]
MKDLHIPARNDTPEIRFEFSRHRLCIYGESFPENAIGFYGPIRSRLQDYLEKLPVDGRVDVNIGLLYSDSSSARLIRALIGMLDRAARSGPSISVHWLLAEDDEVGMEFGIDLMEEHGSLQFNVVVAETA